MNLTRRRMLKWIAAGAAALGLKLSPAGRMLDDPKPVDTSTVPVEPSELTKHIIENDFPNMKAAMRRGRRLKITSDTLMSDNGIQDMIDRMGKLQREARARMDKDLHARISKHFEWPKQKDFRYAESTSKCPSCGCMNWSDQYSLCRNCGVTAEMLVNQSHKKEKRFNQTTAMHRANEHHLDAAGAAHFEPSLFTEVVSGVGACEQCKSKDVEHACDACQIKIMAKQWAVPYLDGRSKKTPCSECAQGCKDDQPCPRNCQA